VTLVAVSKTHPPELVLAAVAACIRHFGENRIEEAGKIAAVRVGAPEIDLTWHLPVLLCTSAAGADLPCGGLGCRRSTKNKN